MFSDEMIGDHELILGRGPRRCRACDSTESPGGWSAFRVYLNLAGGKYQAEVEEILACRACQSCADVLSHHIRADRATVHDRPEPWGFQNSEEYARRLSGKKCLRCGSRLTARSGSSLVEIRACDDESRPLGEWTAIPLCPKCGVELRGMFLGGVGKTRERREQARRDLFAIVEENKRHFARK